MQNGKTFNYNLILILLVSTIFTAFHFLFSSLIDLASILNIVSAKNDLDLGLQLLDAIIIIFLIVMLKKYLIILEFPKLPKLPNLKVNGTRNISFNPRRIAFYFILLGLFAYFIHLLQFIMDQRPDFFLNNHSIAFFPFLDTNDLDLKHSLNEFSLLVLIIKYVLLSTFLEEILFRQIFLRNLLKRGYSILLASGITSFFFTLPFSALIFNLTNSGYFYAILISKFSLSFLLSIGYYLSNQNFYAIYIFHTSTTMYLLLRQISTNNPGSGFYFGFLALKLFLIYFSFILIIILVLVKKKSAFSFPKITKKDLLFLHENIYLTNSLLSLVVLFFVVPFFLSFYFDNIIYISTTFDQFIVNSLKFIGFIFVGLVLYKNLGLEIPQKKTSSNQTKELNKCKTVNKKDTRVPTLQIMGTILGKVLLVILVLLPLFIIRLSGSVTAKVFEVFEIQADITVNYNQHFLYSVLDVDNTLGLILGKSFVFLQNIANQYLFLPTSYYTNPVDGIYGILASLTWFLALGLLLKLITIIIKPKQSSTHKKLKILISYFVTIFIWTLFSLGLYKPSSFLARPTPGTPSPQQPSIVKIFSIQDLSVDRVLIIPFGFLIVIVAIVFLSVIIIKTQLKKKKIKIRKKMMK